MSENTQHTPRTGLDKHREKLVNLLLRVFALFALPPLFMGLIDAPEAMIIPAMLYAPCVISALFPHLDFRFRAWSLIIFVYFAAVSSMMSYGVFSPGRIVAVLVVLLSAVFFGGRARGAGGRVGGRVVRVESVPIERIRERYHDITHDKVVVNDPDAPRLCARFYEIETNRPFICNRDGVAVYSLAEVRLERRTGYA